MTDIDHLIARCALNDRAAFTALYHATSAKLFAVILRVLTNRAEAEEALQEVYIRIWNQSGRFSANQYSPMSWLITIARNHAIDIVRARSAPTVDIDDEIQLPDGDPTPEHHAVNASEGGRIEDCLAELDKDKAAAVTGAYVEGYSYDELAIRYGIPVNTMRTWLRRSLISLKGCLER